MKAKPNMNEVKQRYVSWWKGDLHESPMVNIYVRRDNPRETLEDVPQAKPGDHYFSDMDAVLANFRNSVRMQNYELDSFPMLDLNFGPGSVALYLGSEPTFSPETVWFNPCVHGTWENFPLVYDKDNRWWKEHLRIHEVAQKAAQGEFYVTIPDLVENIDILAAMRDPQQMCFDLIDEPDIVKQRLEELHDLYFVYYDAFYDLLKDKDGASTFTAFKIWGPGKTSKVQCDFNVLMSPDHFREFVCPTLTRQCAQLDNTIFHLDGPDAIRHAPAVLEIPGLNGLQWTHGAGNPDGGDERWYPLYDLVHEAEKCLWVYLEDTDADTFIHKVRKLVQRYGTKRLFVHGGNYLSESEAALICKAAANGFK